MIKVLFFANLREIAQTDSVELPMGSAKVVRDLVTSMDGMVPDKVLLSLQDESAMVSINQCYAGWDGVLSDGDEIGILPPVSGG